MSELLKFLEADKLRTQGEWEAGCHPARPDLSVVRPIMFGNRVGKFPEHEGGAAYFKHVPDGAFIAPASRIAPDLQQLVRDYAACIEVMKVIRSNLAMELSLHMLSLNWQSGEGKARKIHAMEQEAELINTVMNASIKHADLCQTMGE